jgi:hypothetical protein
MAIHSEKNLYPGINIHLNSFLQSDTDEWISFHSNHINDLGPIIDAILPPGYFARAERSLQIGEYSEGELFRSRKSIRPDVSIYRSSLTTSGERTAILEATSPTDTIPITETFPDEESLMSLVIYQAGEGGLLGRPITRMEFLSPSNKVSGSHHGQYIVKRLQTLQSGLRLVEIDYLHQTPPVTHALPNYLNGDEGAFPFTILVNDPRPDFEKGTTQVYGWTVDQPLPIIDIPLAGADKVRVDFNVAYNRTFGNYRYYQMVVDYAQEPINFDSYTKADRQRILMMLEKIRSEVSK